MLKEKTAVGEARGEHSLLGGEREEARRARGLSDEEVARAREKSGENRFTQKPRRGFFRTLWGNLNDPVIRVLLLALLLHLVLLFRSNDWVETVGIAASVVLATLISTVSEYRSETAFSRLSESCGAPTCRVLRVRDPCRRGGGGRSFAA